MTTDWNVEYWIDDSERNTIEYAEYWNDEEAERSKPWDVNEHGFRDVESYLADVGLQSDLEMCLHEVRATTGRDLRGRGIDIAAGTLWAEPILLGQDGVEHVYCLEYSRHRLLTIGPKMLSHYGVDPARVTLALGSFYDLRLPDGSLDFAFLSQALHHADRPEALLGELRRVLRPGGVALIIGEHRIRPQLYLRYAVRALAGVLPAGLRRRVRGGDLDVRVTLRPNGADLEPPDPTLGDHTYTKAEYLELFGATGFETAQPTRRGAHYRSFLLTKRAGA